jgi:peptide/nickel transport system permease protein
MRTWGVFFLRWQNQIALVILIGFVILALGAPWIAPPEPGAEPSPYRQVGRVAQRVPTPPDSISPLGTLRGGLDVFYTLVWGTRTAFRLSLTVVLISATLGTLLGALSGYAGGLLQNALMRITDAFVAFPLIAAVVMFTYLVTPFGIFATPTHTQALLARWGLDPVLLALALFSWMPYARLADSAVSQVKELGFIHASRSLGATPARLILRHLLPNALASQLVYAARDIGTVVVLAASFTFIGLGDVSEWGTLLVLGRDWIISAGGDPLAYWWTYLPLTAAIVFYSIAWNLLGDGLQEHLTPRGHLRPRWTILDAARWCLRSRWFPVAAGLTAGVLAGLAAGWIVSPIPPRDLPVRALRSDLRADYLRATIDSFALNADVRLTYARFRSLGDQAQIDLDAVRRVPAGVHMVTIQRYRSMVEMLLQGEIQSQASPGSRPARPVSAFVCPTVPLLALALTILLLRRRPRHEATAHPPG